MLSAKNLSKRFGSLVVAQELSLELPIGVRYALIGPNGAGKTTLLNTVCGLLPVAGGGYRLSGRVAQVPEGRQLFADMSVEDNLRLGAWTHRQRDPAPVLAL